MASSVRNGAARSGAFFATDWSMPRIPWWQMLIPSSTCRIRAGTGSTPNSLTASGLRVLAIADDGCVHLATSPDGFRGVFFQGHPEYDTISLLKEYKRDVNLYLQREIDSFPPMPENYFDNFSAAVLREYLGRVDESLSQGRELPEFPEQLLLPRLGNTWRDTGSAVVATWVGLVYQITNIDRHKPFMPGVSADNPLGHCRADGKFMWRLRRRRPVINQ